MICRGVVKQLVATREACDSDRDGDASRSDANNALQMKNKLFGIDLRAVCLVRAIVDDWIDVLMDGY